MAQSGNKIIIPTGYMGSGSSAITDLVSEMNGFSSPYGDFEYVFLHCPNGVFDLEDKLLRGNNAIRSDEALRTFRAQMAELYDKPLWWVGDYKTKLGTRFMDAVDTFVDTLTQFTSTNYWYYQERRGLGAFPRLAVNKIVRTVTGGKVAPTKPLLYEGMAMSLPTASEFYTAAHTFIFEALAPLLEKSQNLILDQLLLPFNTWRMDNYFADDAICFVTERDPRDVFLINKYIWKKRDNQSTPYPCDVKEFCDYYRRLRQSEIASTSKQVQHIQFEDLLYRYDDTVDSVIAALGLTKEDHVGRGSRLIPEKSMANTQLFLLDDYRLESKLIAEQLPEYLYDFPYERKPQTALSF